MADSPRFRLTRALVAPRWLTTGDGELVGYSLDLMKDAFVERLRLGLLAKLPETAPTDAAIAMGRDRRLVKGISETQPQYAARLVKWLDDRKRVGNPYALLQKLAEYLGPLPKLRTVDNRGNWYTRDPDGTESAVLNEGNWDWDGHAERWSRFWVVIYPNGLWTESAYDWGDAAGPNWGEDPSTTWGSTAPTEHVQSVRHIVNDWKPAGTRCVNIVIAFDPDSFDPTAEVDDPGMPNGLWGGWSKNVGGVQVPARLSTARYWDGV
jgi:hypothetical protein